MVNTKHFSEASDAGKERLQKVLANAGVASRRAAEIMIENGQVSVNGKTVEEQGMRVDALNDVIRVDGVVIATDISKRYFVFNKPTGVLSTLADDRGRKDLSGFVQHIPERVVNVGRLDMDTSGLLILTNDGDLANKLAHPRYGVQKTYVAKVTGSVTAATIQRLRDGIVLEDGKIAADAAKILQTGNENSKAGSSSLIEITLHSGRNRIVRRMLDHVGHPVEELVRRQFGPLHLGALKLGQLRELSKPEIEALLTSSEDGGRVRTVTAGRPGDGKGAKNLQEKPARKQTNALTSKQKKQQKQKKQGKKV